jgi:hypothetical protein
LPSGHLLSCPACRQRLSELERTMADVADSYRALLDTPLPVKVHRAPPRWLALAATFLLTAGVAALWIRHQQSLVVPNPKITPGEAAPISKTEVCEANTNADNREVPEALREAVFSAYGLANAPRNAYEVDFLITPALGGSASIRNLWPEPYSSRSWNAHTKDVLERRLHVLVCSGQVDLFTAQRDIAANWVAAYKKYVNQ